jgi:phage terminase Nu1 subunit (DNA packaging protein)
VNLGAPITQAAFAQLVGISEAKVSQLVADGILARGDTGHQWVLSYCERLREVAAGRQSGEVGGLDLVQERAALAREQREGIAIKNAVLRKEYAPVELLAKVLATAAQAVADRIDAVPAALKKACPDLPDEARTAVEALLASARNEWVSATASLVEADLELDEDEDESEELEVVDA